MPTVNVSVPFQISQDEALTRIQTHIAQIRALYGNKVSDLRESWSDMSERSVVRRAAFRCRAVSP